jgi:hypothetical protein
MIYLDEINPDWPKRTDDRYVGEYVVANFNPYHGEGGRFATSDGATNRVAGEPTTPCPAPCKSSIEGGSRVGVDADSVPPPPGIGRLPNLTHHERKVESEFADGYEKDPQGYADKYRDLVMQTTKPGDPPTFETDGAKNLAGVWNNPDLNVQCQNRATLNTALHGTANAIAKRAFLDHLDTMNKGENVLVTNGGCGSGKGYSLKNVPEALAEKTRSKAVWDSAGDQNSSENAWVQRECERRGLTATYVHVTADPIKQWADPERGVVKRASDPKDGRMVDAKVYADSYTKGTENMRKFYESNKDNPSAKFVFLDARGHKPVKVDSLPHVEMPSSPQLAAFASTTAANSGAPAHIIRGATLGARIWPAASHNSFCPTGPGGGIDPSCGRWSKITASSGKSDKSKGAKVQAVHDEADRLRTEFPKLEKLLSEGGDIDVTVGGNAGGSVNYTGSGARGETAFMVIHGPLSKENPLTMGSNSVDKSILGAFRHELGHEFQSRIGYSPEWTKIAEPLVRREQQLKEETAMQMLKEGQAVRYKDLPNHVKFSVSMYAIGDTRELFAESFCAFTHKDYKNDLPKPIHKYLTKLLRS